MTKQLDTLFRPDATRAIWTFLICLLASIIEGFDIQALAVSSPILVDRFGLTKVELGSLFAITNVGMTIGAGVGGWLADRYGTKLIFVASVALFGASTCAAAGTAGVEGLAVARFVAGVGFGASIPITILMALNVCATERRAFVVTLSLCGQPLGGIVAIVLAIALGRAFDWRTLFLAGGCAGIALAAVALFVLTKNANPTYAGKRSPESSLTWFAVLFGEGRTPTTLLLWVLFASVFIIAWIFISWLPILVIGKGVPVLAGQQALLTYSIGGIIGAALIGRMIDAFGFKKTLAPVYVLMMVFVLILAAANGVGPILIASALVGACALGSGFALYGVTAAYYPPHIRGRGVGATVAVGRVMSVAAPLAIGGLLAAGVSTTSVLIVVAANALIAALALWGLSQFKPAWDAN